MNIECFRRKLPGVLAGLLIAPLVFACATGAQRQAGYMAQTETDMIGQGRACLDEAYQRPEFAHLKTKLFLDPTATSAPLEYLSDKMRPTKGDIADVYKLHAATQPCRKIYVEGAGRTHPAYVTIIVNSLADTDKLWVEFASGRMTWGDFNQRRADIARQLNQQISEARAMIASQLQNQHEFEMAQRQRAIASLQQWAYQQQVLENQRIAAMSAAASNTHIGNTMLCTYAGPGTVTCN
jgi:hypothetical protein